MSLINKNKITICGMAGTGKGTTADLLAKYYGYKTKSSGNFFRDRAIELGISLNELDELSDKDFSHDRITDQRTKEYGIQNENFIFEGRLAWYFIPDSVKILLVCPFDVRTKRILERENEKTLKQVVEETEHREFYQRKRYKEYYNLEEFDNPNNFDLVVNTEDNNPEQVCKIIVDFISKL